ncbi:MAG: argininosuccinate lyase [Cyclobacteriaceae bacterium]|nr:MAG: argininosuccinate lyase [Cyclobacteriaceae bacterium]
MKLWGKGVGLSEEIERFTIGNDQQLDMLLAPYDVLGSMAHASMLRDIGLLTQQEWRQLQDALVEIYHSINNGDFRIEESVEDIHSQVEFSLTQQLGTVGKKIHSGRSRNDQVLVDIKLYLREEIRKQAKNITEFVEVLLELSEEYQKVIIPGYTHMQAAMPSSFGLWFGAFAETLIDDLKLLKAAYDIVNQNPLGSAAGYGNSFPLDRLATTRLLGFQDLHVNAVAAQMSRGKTETAVAFAIAGISGTIGKMAMDVCLYNSQNLAFLSFPDEITTGSSIMPHKKNPDVFELIRARCNHLQSLPQQIIGITSNLPSGYHRDMQLTKELLLPSLDHLSDCIRLMTGTIKQVVINHDAINDSKYDLIYSVENVNSEVMKGTSFRDAYQLVAKSIGEGSFEPSREVKHTHLGSIGNPGTAEIRNKLQRTIDSFDFESYSLKLQQLIDS